MLERFRQMVRATEIVKAGKTGLRVVIGVTLGIAYFFGVHHAFTKHGLGDGFSAIIIPPYGIYRGAESFWHEDLANDDRRPFQESSTVVEPYEAHCKEPLPVFTLSKNSHPTEPQETALCTCIWGNLGGWGRETSEKIAHGKESDVSELHMLGFRAKFGEALEKCGGMKL